MSFMPKTMKERSTQCLLADFAGQRKSTSDSTYNKCAVHCGRAGKYHSGDRLLVPTNPSWAAKAMPFGMLYPLEYHQQKHAERAKLWNPATFFVVPGS